MSVRLPPRQVFVLARERLSVSDLIRLFYGFFSQGLIESDSTDDEMDLPPWFQAGGPGAPAGGPPPQIVNPMDFLGQLFGAPPGHFNFQGIEGDPLQNNPVEGDENADEDPEIGGNQIFRTLLDNLFLRQSSDINGIAWLQHRSLFYVAYGHCIQEYKVQIGAPTLKEICSEFVLKSKEKWGEWGWSKDLVEDVFATCNV